MDKRLLLQLTADIVASHASMNEMGQEDLLAEIDRVYQKLASLAGEEVAEQEAAAPAEEAEVEAPPKPAVPLEAAFGKEKIFCMVCGKGMKTLKRHLTTAHGLKPGQYRRMFGIPAGTPLVARDYSEARKKMAEKLNLAERLVEARRIRAQKLKAKKEG